MDNLRRCLATAVVAAGLAGSAAAATVTLHLAQQGGAPLAEAALLATPLDDRPLPAAAAAVMDQRDRKFVPHILVVQTHARVTFPNSDNVTHHVYSFSTPRRFQIYLEKGGAAKTVSFDKPGVVTLGCNLHDWMLGYILVVDTPYFRQTDAAGDAELSGLPAGRYRLELWHPRITDAAERLAREVTLAADGGETWSLRLERPVLPPRDQKPGFAEY
jgi:plastocyanin